jgi:hypothetical protein
MYELNLPAHWQRRLSTCFIGAAAEWSDSKISLGVPVTLLLLAEL